MKGLLIHFHVTDGKQADFEAATSELVRRVRANDPSYQLYSLARVKSESSRYVLMQRFESYETQLNHQTYPYVLEAMTPIQACLASEPIVQFLDILD